MNSVHILAVVWMKKHIEKACEYIKSFKNGTLFIKLPESFQEWVNDLARGIPVGLIRKELQEFAFFKESSFDSWWYYVQPLLEAIRGISSRDVRVRCYLEDKYFGEALKFPVTISLLTLNVSLTGKIDAKKWIDALRSYTNAQMGFIEHASRNLLENLSKRGRNLAIFGLEGRHIWSKIKGFVDADLIYIGLPYYYTPIEVLMHKLQYKDSVSEEEIKYWVNCHLDYIRNYVLVTENVDEAYEKWVRDKYGRSLKRENCPESCKRIEL